VGVWGWWVWWAWVWWACPHNNHAQNEAPSRGAYCEKSYAGGDNNIERTQARTRTPAPPHARQACGYLERFWMMLFFLEIARYA